MGFSVMLEGTLGPLSAAVPVAGVIALLHDMYRYHQSTGVFERDGVTLFTGDAGHGAGVNNPSLQQQHNVGPLPQGRYTMLQFVAKATKTGLGTIRLQPDPANQMFGRSAFCIHGDNSAHNRSASTGCIIIGRAPDRQAIWNDPDHDVEVVG